VRGLFEFEEQPPISVKGVEQPMGSWLVVRALPRTQRGVPRGVDGVHTRMVGRDAELDLLLQTLQRTVVDGRASAITVVGEAGLGKSRLLAEFEHQLDAQQVWLLLGRAHPRSAVEPFGVLRDLLLRHLQIGDNEPAAAARDKLVGQLGPLLADAGEAPVHLLGHLVGLDFSASPHVRELLGDEALLRQRAFAAGALWLRRLGAMRPVVMVLDDLHWADQGSIDFVQHVMHEDADVPQLCLTLTRQTVFEQHAQWMREQPRHTRLDLKPLDHAHSQELAGGLLQRMADVPEALRALVIDGAEGNPFYMEELVKMFIDDGVIVVEPEGWHVRPDKLLHAHVPPTLTGVLQARLDALGADERRALQQAAVVGHEFWDQALAAIDPAALQHLPQLLAKELIVPREVVAPDDTREYMFKHHLLQQVTYDSVLKAPKRDGHAKVGAFWSARAEVSSEQEVDPAHCRALAEAQYHRCQAETKDYLGWFAQQFDHYLYAWAGPTLRPLAEQLVEVAEKQFGADDATTARVLCDLARVMLIQGEAAKVEPLLTRAISIQQAKLPDDHADTALTLAVLGGYHEGRGDATAAEPFFRRALEIREKALGPEHKLTLSTLDNLAKTMLELDRLAEAEVLSRRVLAAHERRFGPNHTETAFALTALGEVLYKQGHHAAAEPLIRRALAVQQRALSPEHPDTGLSMWHLAKALQGLQRHDEAEPLARCALTLWEGSFGIDHEWTGWGLICLAEIRLAQGNAADAASLAEQAARVLLGVYGTEHAVLASTLVLQAQALMQLGDAANAEPLLMHALAIQNAARDESSASETAVWLERTRALLASG
jgi:tetratricopeptide (TPR) repeat protein